MVDELRAPVVLRRFNRTWTVDLHALCASSLVLRSILLCSDPDSPRELTLEDSAFDEEAIDAWVELLLSTGHDARAFPPASEIAVMAAMTIPLVHKYDCKGLLCMLRSALNQFPVIEGVIALLQHDDATDWIHESTSTVVVRWMLRADNEHPLHRSNRVSKDQLKCKLDAFAPTVQVFFLVHAVTCGDNIRDRKNAPINVLATGPVV